MTARVGIGDVAEAAGVSTATVSRALRGLPNVSPATRAHVATVATRLGYATSRSASSLATGRTSTVGLVTPHLSRWYFAHLLEAIESALASHGYDVLVHRLAPDDADQRPAFDARHLRERVDAVLVLSVPLTGAELDGVRALRLPLAFVGAAMPGAISVRIDDVAVGRTATEHLLALGHRRIAHVGGDPAQPLNFAAPTDRRAGWASALRDGGLAPCRELDVAGHFTVEGGRAAGHALLALPDPPTAVFAGSDEMAIGVLVAAREAGVRVPDELAVVGVDDHEHSALFDLTTVSQPVGEQGRLAAELLLAALAGVGGRTEHVLLPTRLVVRGSTLAGQTGPLGAYPVGVKGS